jgi:hypothetical protein
MVRFPARSRAICADLQPILPLKAPRSRHNMREGEERLTLRGADKIECDERDISVALIYVDGGENTLLLPPRAW